jgi:regulator of RNase E activity RraA
MPLSPDVLRKLARYDTPTICNVIELFDIRPRTLGYMDGRIRANFPELPPMVGLAATATFRSAAPPRGPDVYESLEQQLRVMSELGGPAVVVIQDVDDPPQAAVFGEVMCSTYQGFGAVGLVTSGAGRDLAQVQGLKFPVFTGGTICSHGYCHLLHVGHPVRVGGLVVETGDLLHGDANGVTSIPLEIAGEIASVIDDYVAAEQVVIEYVTSAGPKTLEEFSARRQEAGRMTEKLKQRVAGAGR